MFTIYSFGNGDALIELFNGLALVFAGGRYEGLLRFALLMLAVGVLAYAAFRGRFLGHVLVGGVVLVALATSVTVAVSIEDQVNPLIPPQVVNNVPFIVAVPFAVGSEIEFQVSNLLETALSIPGVYRATGSSYNRFLFDMQKTLDVTLMPGDLRLNLESFVRMCVFPEIRINNATADDYLQAVNLLTQLGTVLNPARFATRYANGNPIGTMICPDHYNTVIFTGFTLPSADYSESMRRFRVALQTDPDLVNDEINFVDPIIGLWGIGQTARTLINNVLIRDVWEKAERQDFVRLGDTAATIDMSLDALQQEVKYQAYTSATIAKKFVPVLRTIAEGMIILLTPFLFILAFQPGMGRVLGSYVRLFTWVHLWGPIYVVMNFVMFLAAENETTPLIDSLGGVAIQNFDAVREHVALLNSVAAQANWGVPVIAWALLTGGSHVAGAAVAGFAGVRSASDSVSRQFAQGQGQVRDEGPSFPVHTVSQAAPVGSGLPSGTWRLPDGGAPGLGIRHQSGSTEVVHGDGGVSRLGPAGTVMYRGPHGAYVKDRHGKLVEGFTVSSRGLPGGGTAVERTEVTGGNQLQMTTTERDRPDGVVRTVEERMDADGHPISRTAEVRTDGWFDREETLPDGSGKRTGYRYGAAHIKLGPGGREEYFQDGVLTYTQPIKRSGEPGVMQGTFISSDGRHVSVNGEVQEAEGQTGLPVITSLQGEITNVTGETSQIGNELLTFTHAGDGRTQYSRVKMGPQGFRDVDGRLRSESGYMLDRGFQRGDALVSTGAKFFNDDGTLVAEGRFLEGRMETVPPLHPDVEAPTRRRRASEFVAGHSKSDSRSEMVAANNGIVFQAQAGEDGKGLAVAKGVMEDVPVYRGGNKIGQFDRGTLDLIGQYDSRTGAITPFEQGFRAVTKDGRFSGFVTEGPGGKGFEISQGSFSKLFSQQLAGPYGLPTEIRDVQNSVVGVAGAGWEGKDPQAGGLSLVGAYRTEEQDAVVPIRMGDQMYFEQARFSETGQAFFRSGAQLGDADAIVYQPSTSKLTFHDSHSGAIAHVEGVRGEDGVIDLKSGEEQNFLHFKMAQDGLLSSSQVGQDGRVVAEEVRGGVHFDTVGPDGTRYQGVSPIGGRQVLGVAKSVKEHVRIQDSAGRPLFHLDSAEMTSSAIFDRQDPEGSLAPVSTTFSATTPEGHIRGNVVPVDGEENAYRLVDGEFSNMAEFEMRDPDTGLPLDIEQAGGGGFTYEVKGNTDVPVLLHDRGGVVPVKGYLFERGEAALPAGATMSDPGNLSKDPSIVAAQFRVSGEGGNVSTYNVKGRYEDHEGQRVFVPETGDANEFLRAVTESDGYVRDAYVSQSGADRFVHGMKGKDYKDVSSFMMDRRYESHFSAVSFLHEGEKLFGGAGQLDPEDLTPDQRQRIHDLGVAAYGAQAGSNLVGFAHRSRSMLKGTTAASGSKLDRNMKKGMNLGTPN